MGEQEEDIRTILFVDDEQNILSSLRRMLRKEPWGLRFANSGYEGLDILGEQHIDLVVSDMRMPEMDGAEFLKHVKDQYPETVRIILSGYAEKESVASVLQEECAHQMLTKPWNRDELIGLLHALLDQSDTQKESGAWLKNTLTSLTSLPTLPQIYLQIKEALSKSDDLSAAHIAEVIEQDPSISLRLLRWSNSTLFGQANRVDTVQRAVVVLGIEMVQGLVLSMAVFDALGNTPEIEGFERDAFWTHCMGCGLIASHIVKNIFKDEKLAERTFTAGLLHDLGKIVEDCYDHSRFQKAVDIAREKGLAIRDVEPKVLHTTHMEVGAHLAQWWNLPSSVVRAIRWHHAPHLSDSDQDLVGAVHIADALVQKWQVGSSGNFCAPKVETTSWQKFKPSKVQLKNLEDLLKQAVP